MKKIITLAIAFVVVAIANRPVVLSDLDSLAALDQAEHLDGTKQAFQAVNETALHVLPTAATLRTEDAIAAIALKLSDKNDVAVVAAR